MIKKISLSIKVLLCIVIVYSISIATSKISHYNKSFRDILLDYIESNSQKKADPIIKLNTKDSANSRSVKLKQPFIYLQGDWEKYVTSRKYKLYSKNYDNFRIEEEGEVDLSVYGSMQLNLTYGKSKFTNNKYKTFADDRPVSKIINSGFNHDRELLLHVEGEVGKRLSIYIDHDSRKKDNHYLMKYRAIRDEEIIREINAGEIEIDINNSKYAVYDDTSSKAVGIDLTLKKDNLHIKAFASIIQGETEVEIFRGNSSPNHIKLHEYQYIRNKYYQLEPFNRYDGMVEPPAASDNPYSTMITFTSSPSNPESYTPSPVNIDPANFELYMDDQDSNNNLNSLKLNIDNGYYDRLVSGEDYAINYSTGLITLLKAIPNNARIFVIYTVNNGGVNSSDPSATIDGSKELIDESNGTIYKFYNRIFVFIKYGYSINEDLDGDFELDNGEDRNNDGKLGLDIYEVRSFYQIGEKQIIEDNFKIQFFNENSILRGSEISRLGKYFLNYSAGIIGFYLREPFRKFFNEDSARIIYSENQSKNTFSYSQYNIRIDYYREARSFKLQHQNIIPNSVRIKINGREIISSLYSIDYTSGFLQFIDPNNPVIGEETEIEIKYEYLPFDSQSQLLIGGVRADYKINRNLDIGGTLLFTKVTGDMKIPDIGNEPEQTLILEMDSSLHLGEKRLKALIKSMTGLKVRTLPVEVRGYAEYAKSYKKKNTFGKALIDNMEDTVEIHSIPLSEDDWIISSMPEGADPANRGVLHYRFYRDPSHPKRLRGVNFTPYEVDYTIKPGPYNIATGHLKESIQSKSSQRSLVLNFDFSNHDYVAIATRSLSTEAVDFSGLQYVEIWYRSEGGQGSVELYLDIGKIDEDSDGDSIMDSEDINNNGFLDFDPSAGIYEDIGYEFNNPDGTICTIIGTGPKLNSVTTGNGILDSEDLNRNGILEHRENILTFPGNFTFPGSVLSVDLSDTHWQKARIYLDRSRISNGQLELLKQVESLRLYLKKKDIEKGVIYINNIRFVSSSWRDVEMNNIIDENPSKFNVTMINTYCDADYKREAFIFSNKAIYKSLYGNRSDRDLRNELETALQIDYDLSTVNNVGQITKRFQKPLDIRYYRTLNLWLNYRSFTPGDEVGILLGSSESDYIEYRFPMDYPEVWRQIKLKLKSKSHGAIEKLKINNNPDMKRISYIKLIIYGNNGKLWVNDIYVSDPENLDDRAYWYEGEVKFKRPLFYINESVPVLSDVEIVYINKGHGFEFSTIGKTTDAIKEKYSELFSSALILPNWKAQMDYMVEISETDSRNEEVIENKRGKTTKRDIFIESDYVSKASWMPSIKLIYKQENYKNRKEEFISDLKILKQTKNRIYNPLLILNGKINNFPGGRLKTIFQMDIFFKEEKINRTSDTSPDELEGLISIIEKEKRQKSRIIINIDYQGEYFFINPIVDFSSHEIVELKGRSDLNDTEILNDVNGNYHLPLIYNENLKFVERNKRAHLRMGLNDLGIFSPRIEMEMRYYENRFRGYDENELDTFEGFSRARDATSFISNNIDLIFKFNKINNLKFIRNFNISFNRSIYFHEIDIPYEGEGSSPFDEKYGIKRAYNGIANRCLNLINYYPWYSFKGRGNYSNGRDYVYNLYNEGLAGSDGFMVSNYNNNLRLIDNAFISSMFDFGSMVVSWGGGINQVSTRPIIYGIPQQVITINQNCDINIDLMQIFHFGFFRSNRAEIPHHSANMNFTYKFNRVMLITSNTEENLHSPGIGLTFKWDRTSIAFIAEVGFIQRNKREYISLDESKRAGRDAIYISNMQVLNSFKEKDRVYDLSILFETDVLWIFNIFSRLYKLISYPIFNIEYSLLLNRYDYSFTASPMPYDQHMVSAGLTLNLHENVQGEITTRWALERYRNYETNGINREILSYEAGLNFSLLF